MGQFCKDLKGEGRSVSRGNWLSVKVSIWGLVVDTVRDATDDDALYGLVHMDAEKEAVALHLYGEGVSVMLADEFVRC